MGIATKLTAAALVVDYNNMSYRAQTIAALTAAGVPAATVLQAAKAWLKIQVDAEAEALRAAVLVPGTGQAMEYMEANAEAQAALASSIVPTAPAYPMLAAGVGLDIDPQSNAPAADVIGVARAVAAQYAKWVQVGAAIRAARLKGKAAIDAAATIDAAAAAVDAIAWPATST